MIPRHLKTRKKQYFMNSLGDNVVQNLEPAQKHISIASGKRKGEAETIYYANPIMYSFDELHDMSMWCINTFGKPGRNLIKNEKIWDYQQNPDYWFWFYEEKYLARFILRWS